jgi:hypothetical protein
MRRKRLSDEYQPMFKHLILLIGTNPLPNFVIADYFLQHNKQLQTIWLVHSERNDIQAGTLEQAENLEKLLHKFWVEKHPQLKFPLQKIALSDVSNANAIRREVEQKILSQWNDDDTFHLNYTGGTKSMATHVYYSMKESKFNKKQSFSYLDANNFRLVVDDYGVIVKDLRKQVQLEFADLIALHGFQRINKDSDNITEMQALQAYQRYISDPKTNSMNEQDGNPFELYLKNKLTTKFGTRLNSGSGILLNWKIKKVNWRTDFELDIILLNGYQPTVISSTVSSKKSSCKNKGFEVILRSRQIGGDEARAILITRSNRQQTQLLQEELIYETGRDKKNILVLGIEDLRNEEIYLRKIKEFVLD